VGFDDTSSLERQPPGVDLGGLGEWMDTQGLPPGPIERVEPLTGGSQNVLLRLERGGRAYVLRRPPLHKRANSDETMRREARVLGALASTDVPHPRLIAACADVELLGAAFYLMEPVTGFNPATGLPALHASDAGLRSAMGHAFIDAIVALGRVDHVAVGLADFGRVEGFLERQVERWRSQLDGYGKLDGYDGPDIPGVEAVAAWLDENRPRSFVPGIIHGDYHMANVLFALDGPRLVAIVDWELSTIGDPLIDLGWVLATWPNDDGSNDAGIVLTPWEGFPKAAALLDLYRDQSSRDLSAISWYAVLACYKLGIILEGTHARACAGKADAAVGDVLHAMTLGLFRRAERFMRVA
jgi:aminoglycoside phosphotransferase (APT) family kinase protein